jgi:hypothetical protein
VHLPAGSAGRLDEWLATHPVAASAPAAL